MGATRTQLAQDSGPRCDRVAMIRNAGWFAVALVASVVADVDAAQTCDTSVHPASTTSARFKADADGTVTDTRSKLMWMRCSAGQRWTGSRCTGTPQSLTFPSAQSVADEINRSGSAFFSDWRVPRMPELASIAERECSDPRINLELFPDTPASFYWTTTSRRASGPTDFVYALSFGAEGFRYVDRGQANLVRLVRDAL